MQNQDDKWTFRWKNWLRPTRTPGLYELKDGGYLFRRMVTDPTTGRRVESKRVLKDIRDEAVAVLEMQKAVVSAMSGKTPVAQLPRMRFSEFAASLYERKVNDNELKTPASVRRWGDTLPRLLIDTKGASGLVVHGLGECYLHMLEEPIGLWRTAIQMMIKKGDFAPSTANGWLSILKVITKEIAYEHKIHDPCSRVKKFDESEHDPYPEEDPNALPPGRVPEFLELIRQHFPQHYAMSYLGFYLGLRPSSLRPLRRRGAESDIKWDMGRILVRQSQTYGDEVVKTTKQKKRYSIDAPTVMFEILDWHIKTQLKRPEQRSSDLLFPSNTGGFRARSVLDKPFTTVSEMMDLGYVVSASGMRRTFQDMQRFAKIEPIITRSISGHLTEKMQEHYSTVQNTEQRNAIAQVIHLFGPQSTQLECALPNGSTQLEHTAGAHRQSRGENTNASAADGLAGEHTSTCAPQTSRGAL